MFDREHQPSLPQRTDHYGSAGTPLGVMKNNSNAQDARIWIPDENHDWLVVKKPS